MEEDPDAQAATLDAYNSHEQSHRDESQWTQCTSDNGDAYFTNVATGETSWTKPGSEHELADGWTDVSIGDAGARWEEALPPVAVETTARDGDEWLKLYDPLQDVCYYFSPQSGEVRWEPPLEATAIIRHCDNDAVLNTVASLQSAARSHQVRARFTAMKQQKMNESQPENGNSTIVAKNDEVDTDAVQLSKDNPEEQDDGSQWVEVYDPVTQQQYYYCSRTNETRWDPPEELISSAKDRNVTEISTQWLARGRQQIFELRAHSPERNKEPQSFGSVEDESELEATCRREMNHQELLQLKGGDRFWGLDLYEREMIQKRIEDELMERTKALNEQCVSLSVQGTNVAYTQLGYPAFDDLYDEEMDPERLKREQKEENDARITMFNEETQQCQNGDIFWGIQAEEARQNAANIAMAQEETDSRRFAVNVLEQALSATWEAEVQQNVAKELAARGGLEQRMQERYLHWFYRQCVSVDELLGYRWPTKQQQECFQEEPSPVKKRRYPVVEPNPDAVFSATPYPLDNLVVRDRLENGDLRYGLRSILTVHHQSARGTNGAHFEITQASPECAFDETTAAVILKCQVHYSDERVNRDEVSLDGFDNYDGRSGYGSHEGDTTPGSSVNYRRSRTPDPHIPARFNGVPYKPNQMSPTQDILSGDHRKLNQLPSLSKLKSSSEAPKIRHLQKAKTKARTKTKAPSAPAQQPSNNRNDADSPRESETDQVNDAVDEGPRTQFKRQEHDVLSKLFALMDLDGSGTVNQDEMQWALQRDAEIHALATTSPLLRILLKQRARLEALFSSQTVEGQSDCGSDVDIRSGSSHELSWDEFLARCEHSYLHLMSEGLIQPDVAAATTRTENAHTKGVNSTKDNREEYPKSSARETEAQTIRKVFALLDNDGNGVLEVAEVQRALYNSTATTPKSASESKELRALVEGSRALQPMLHQELFMTAFTKFEPMDPRGISEEEFVAFCLEIAQVAAANNMVVSVQ